MTRIRNVRNTTKFKRSIKAISPVIATLLMIAIAVVASLVVYAWVTGYMGNTTSKAGKAIQIQSFAVDDSKALHVYVQNVGQGALTLSTAYVNSTLQPFTADSHFADNVLPEGNTADIIVAGTYNVNDKLNIKITTTEGTFMTTTGTVKTSGSANPPPGGTYPVNFVLGSGGLSMNPAAGSQNVGGDVAITATANTGYHFTSWTNTGSITFADASVASTTATVNGAGTITANFAANTVQYQITVSQTNNGVIAPGTTSYDAGSTPTFTITPNAGYHIASITANGGAVTVTTPAGQTYQFAALSADGTLTAIYAVDSVIQYQITVIQTPNGNIAPGTTSYDAGSTPSFTIAPSSGYHIATITANGGSVAVTNPAGQTYQFAALSASGTLTATYSANIFGNLATGSNANQRTIENTVVGGVFTTPGYSITAQSISAWVEVTTTYHMKAAIYTTSGSLVGTVGTQERTVSTSQDNQFVVFTYAAGTGPTLTANTQYVIVVWAESITYQQAYLDASSGSGGSGRYDSNNYGSTFPSSVGTFSTDTINYSIYVTYSIP